MVQGNSRTANFSRNAAVAAIAELTTMLLSFLVRVFFVRCLNAEYLGINGLFSNILTILSLAELGAGTAIVYSMYKPLAENDREKIKSLTALYKKLYITIGCSVLILGLSFIPILDFFIKERPSIPYSELITIYILTVVQTASSYFFSYRYSIFRANQQGYIVQSVTIVASVVRSLLQIAILVLFRNYIVYLVVGIIVTLASNFYLTNKADRAYPYLREKAEKLDSESLGKIKKNIFAMLLYRLGIVTATTIDTLLISKLFGVIQVGIYSNYHLIISYSDKLFTSVLGTITPSLGNLMVTADDEKKMQVFSAIQLVYYWLATYLAVGMIVCFNRFIELVFGKEYLFDLPMVIALISSITLTNFQRPCSLVRDATGLFWYGKLRPLAMAALNIFFSIIAAHLWGAIGVVIGTSLSKLFTYVWYDPYIVFKYSLKGSLKKYFWTYFLHWVLLAFLSLMCLSICRGIQITGWAGFFLDAIIVTLIVNGAFFLIYYKRERWNYLAGIAKPILQRHFKGNGK